MPTYSVVTFGCQMNMHDSERMAEVLSAAGYESEANPELADVVLLNTCSVREKAEQKLRSEVGRLGVLKRKRPELVIGVAGCVAQQEGERLIKSLPQIDLVIGPDNIPELPTLLADAQAGAPPRARTVFDYDAPQFLAAHTQAHAGGETRRNSPCAFVTTMKGCDERCTFCIVPYTRGSERYRPSGEVLDEIARLVASGVREVTLLGQTVDSYRDPSGQLPAAKAAGDGIRRWGRRSLRPEDETEFPALLRAIVEHVPGLARLRYTSPHPRHLTPALVAAHEELPVLCKHVHMPVQSGSDAVLKRMGRRYSRGEYLERLAMLREAVPGLTLSTDIIVGFPGETAEQFEETLSLVREVGFVGVYAFKYSPRPYTPALNLGDDIPEEEKSRRLAALLDLSEEIRSRHLESLVGQECTVLVEGTSKSGAYTGRTERNEIVHFGCVDNPTGELVRLRIQRALRHSLVGQLVDEVRAVDFDVARERAAEVSCGASSHSHEPHPHEHPPTAAPKRDGNRVALPVVAG
jgi:tRNA-2-methylthio-N6-dimethylallyladenosine synthase